MTLGRIVIVVFALATAYFFFQVFSSSRPIGSENLIGSSLPEFAAPLAGSGLNFDSNIFTAIEARRARSTAACDVKVARVFVSCRDLTGISIVAFWNSTKNACVHQIDELDRVVTGMDEVKAVAVAFNDKRLRVAALAQSRGWKLPVAIDRDGAAGALYSVAGCPSTFFASDGVIRWVRLGSLTEAELRARIRGLGGSDSGSIDGTRQGERPVVRGDG